MKLTPKQTKAIDYLEDDCTTEVLYGGAAGGGKSWMGCYWLLKMCMKYPETRWLMGRAKLKALEQTTLITFWKVCKEQGITTKHYRYNSQKGTIKFFNGSQIILKDLFLYPSDRDFDGLGSLEITGAFIDEANQIVEKAKDIVSSRIRHGLDENGLIPKLLMSCNPSNNWVKKTFYDLWKRGNLPKYKKFIQAYVTDNPEISKHYIDQLKKMRSKASKERLLLGNWEYSDDPTILMDNDSIMDIWSNEHVYDGIGEIINGVKQPDEKYITADIARYGSDWFFLFVWSGWRIVDYAYLEKSSTQDCLRFIEGMRAKHAISKSNTLCDEDGIGGGVVDMGGYRGFHNGASAISTEKIIEDPDEPRNEHKENYKNLSNQCSFIAAQKVATKDVYVACDMEPDVEARFVEECQVQKTAGIDKQGKLSTIKKEDIRGLIGRSPDIWDSFKMRVFFDLLQNDELDRSLWGL